MHKIEKMYLCNVRKKSNVNLNNLTIPSFYDILICAKWRVYLMPRLCVLNGGAFRWVFSSAQNLPKVVSGLHNALHPLTSPWGI